MAHYYQKIDDHFARAQGEDSLPGDAGEAKQNPKQQSAEVRRPTKPRTSFSRENSRDRDTRRIKERMGRD